MQKKLFQLSMPIFVESMLGTIIGSIDTIMLSSYSDNAVAAVSIANQILFLIQVLVCIVNTGTSILCAQYIGAKKTEDEQNDLITASILMNVGIGVVLTILMSAFYPMILNLLNLSGLVRDYAGEYLKVINWFLWVQLISSILSAILRSYGKTKQCMYVSMGINVCNIVLNYLLIFRNQMFFLFTSDPEIVALAGTVLLANFLLEAGRSQNLVYVNALRAVGDVKFPFYIGIVSMWFIAVGGSYFLGIVLNMGLFGVWIAQGLDECFRAVGMGIRWKKKGYTRIEVTK